MSTYIIRNSDELRHFGISGQRWGVRRFENLDGTLTPEGKERYYGSQSQNSRLSKRLDIQRKVSAFRKQVGLGQGDGIDSVPDKIKNARILPTERDSYRQEMLERYKGQPANIKKYTEMTDQELENEIRRKQDLKRKLIIAGAALGVTAGVAATLYIRKRGIDVGADLLDSGLDVSTPDGLQKFKDSVAGAMQSESEEFKTVLDEGSVIHRMFGFKDFDLAKAGSDPMYTSYLRQDVDTYSVFLADHFGTGKRYDVALQTTKSIKIPTRAEAAAIIDDLMRKDPEFLRGKDSLSSAHKLGVMKATLKTVDGMTATTQFREATYSMVLKNSDAKKLQKELLARGFDAIYDYFDIDSGFTQRPLIFLDPQGSLKKVGETFVDKNYEKEAVSRLVEDYRTKRATLSGDVKYMLHMIGALLPWE